MKKIVLLILLFIGFIFLNARFINSFGVKGGLVVSNQDFDYKYVNSDMQNLTRFDIGLFLELLRNSNLNILAEFHYVQKGMIYEINNYDDNGNYLGMLELKNHAEYITLQIFGKFAYNLKKSSPYIIMGPRIDFLTGYYCENNLFDSVYEDFKSFDFGATFGIGFEFRYYKSQAFLFEMRFSPSFTNSYETESLTVKNNSFEFLTGIKF
ncbi:MAG: PorT family protein [Candidatus Cloacimonetes bacterium]|nr:PorT family protein [Candidatus Cloacimonadota bacterium]